MIGISSGITSWWENTGAGTDWERSLNSIYNEGPSPKNRIDEFERLSERSYIEKAHNSKKGRPYHVGQVHIQREQKKESTNSSQMSAEYILTEKGQRAVQDFREIETEKARINVVGSLSIVVGTIPLFTTIALSDINYNSFNLKDIFSGSIPAILVYAIAIAFLLFAVAVSVHRHMKRLDW